MTNEEAIKAIRDNYPPSRYSMLREALTMAIDALEKQIPKKPYAIEDEVYGVMKICPVCSWRVINGVSDYCLHCGQAIDWSE